MKSRLVIVGFYFTDKKSTWIGVSAIRRETFFDPSADLIHPLQFAEYSQKVFANGSLYDEETAFDFNIRKWKGPCLYLRASNEYEPEETECEKEMTYICEWKSIHCPVNYKHSSHLHDGRTCVGQTEEPVILSDNMCDTGTDKQRKYLTELDLNLVYSLKHSWNSSLWLGIHNLESQEWSYLNGSLVNPSKFEDLTPSPWYSNFEPSNATSCVIMVPSGSIEISNTECFQKNHALCSFRSCLTTEAEECIFPFKYSNKTADGFETELTYYECSTVDLYQPWCPTGKIF